MNKRGDLEVEVGVPVKDTAAGDSHVVAGTFPSGKYATLKYFGDYRNMKGAHMELESWISKKGLKEKQNVTDDGIVWGARIEFYITDLEIEIDPDKWETDIVFLLQEDVTNNTSICFDVQHP
jgi:effector-binding domain-containing protein